MRSFVAVYILKKIYMQVGAASGTSIYRTLSPAAPHVYKYSSCSTQGWYALMRRYHTHMHTLVTYTSPLDGCMAVVGGRKVELYKGDTYRQVLVSCIIGVLPLPPSATHALSLHTTV